MIETQNIENEAYRSLNRSPLRVEEIPKPETLKKSLGLRVILIMIAQESASVVRAAQIQHFKQDHSHEK